jgi:transketolase
MVVEERDLRPDAVVHAHAGARSRHAAGVDQLTVNTIQMLAIDAVEAADFGASVPARVLCREFGREFGFTPENVAARARRLLAHRGRS